MTHFSSYPLPTSSFQSPTKPRGRDASGGVRGDGGGTGRGGGGLGRGVGGSGGFSLAIGGGIRGAKRKVEATHIFDDPANTFCNATSGADESTLSAFDGSQPQHSGPGQPRIQT